VYTINYLSEVTPPTLISSIYHCIPGGNTHHRSTHLEPPRDVDEQRGYEHEPFHFAPILACPSPSAQRASDRGEDLPTVNLTKSKLVSVLSRVSHPSSHPLEIVSFCVVLTTDPTSPTTAWRASATTRRDPKPAHRTRELTVSLRLLLPLLDAVVQSTFMKKGDTIITIRLSVTRKGQSSAMHA
jgi:hypothetical protein